MNKYNIEPDVVAYETYFGDKELLRENLEDYIYNASGIFFYSHIKNPNIDYERVADYLNDIHDANVGIPVYEEDVPYMDKLLNLMDKEELSLGNLVCYNKNPNDDELKKMCSFSILLKEQDYDHGFFTQTIAIKPIGTKGNTIYLPADNIINNLEQYKEQYHLGSNYNLGMCFDIIAHEISANYSVKIDSLNSKDGNLSIKELLECKDDNLSIDKEMALNTLVFLHDTEVQEYDCKKYSLVPLKCENGYNLKIVKGAGLENASFKNSHFSNIGSEDFVTKFEKTDFSNTDLSEARIECTNFINCTFNMESLENLPKECKDVKFENCNFNIKNQEMMAEFYNKIKNDYKDTFLINCTPSYSQLEKATKTIKVDKNKSAGRK